MKTWQVSVRDGKNGLYRLIDDFATREEALEAWKEIYFFAQHQFNDVVELDCIYQQGLYHKAPRPTEAERVPADD